MITLLISIREIDINYYSINKYILLKIYFLNIKNNIKIRIKIIQKIYLIDDFKIKIFLEIDFLNLKRLILLYLKTKFILKFIVL